MTRNFVAPIATALLVLAGAGNAARAADAPLSLHWAELVPKTVAPPPATSKTFFAGSTPQDGTQPPQPIPEGKFMSTKRRQPGGDKPPAVVAELDGKRVSIGGYVVPLDFEATTVKEFLLVPFVGACIHVPPPPANQIIYVKSDKGFDVNGTFDPVTVTGILKTTVAFTGLADVGYTLDADAVEPRKP